MAALTMTLGGITFNGAADGNGVSYRVLRFDGWDSPDVRQTVLDRVGDEGGILAESFYGTRTIILRGWIIAPTYTALWQGWNSLTTASDLVDANGTLVVNEPTPKQVFVRRSGRLQIDWWSDTKAEFQLTLLAVDPRKYANGSTTTTVGV